MSTCATILILLLPFGQSVGTAIEQFEAALQKNPRDEKAVLGMAEAYEKARQFAKAREYYLRLAELRPLDGGSFSAVGAIDWAVVCDKRNPPPLEEQERLIDEGLRYLDIALGIHSGDDAAMSYRNLLLREKARLTPDVREKQRLIDEADQWFKRALAARKRQSPMAPMTDFVASPPPRLSPSILRVPTSAAERNLLFRAPVTYPQAARDARIQGQVRVEITIGRDGATAAARILSGHPLLCQAALDNVKLWRYRPFLLNGIAVESVTQVTVIFKLPQPALVFSQAWFADWPAPQIIVTLSL